MKPNISETVNGFRTYGYAYAGSVSVGKSIINFIESFTEKVLNKPNSLFLSVDEGLKASAVRANPESTGFDISNMLVQQDPWDRLNCFPRL